MSQPSAVTRFANGVSPWANVDTRKLKARNPMPPRKKPQQAAPLKKQASSQLDPGIDIDAAHRNQLELAPKNMTKPSNAAVDLSKLSICDDPIPTYKSQPEGKYDALLANMKPGQAIKCPTGDIDRIANAIKKHIDRRHPNCVVRTMRDYGDGMGRVWMLPKPEALKPKA